MRTWGTSTFALKLKFVHELLSGVTWAVHTRSTILLIVGTKLRPNQIELQIYILNKNSNYCLCLVFEYLLWIYKCKSVIQVVIVWVLSFLKERFSSPFIQVCCHWVPALNGYNIYNKLQNWVKLHLGLVWCFNSTEILLLKYSTDDAQLPLSVNYNHFLFLQVL